MVFSNDLLGRVLIQGSPVQETNYTKHCEAEIIFGVQSQNCSGNGICQLFLKGTLNYEKPYCHFGEVRISIDLDENLLIKVQKSTLRKATLKKHFANNEFRVEEDFLLPSFVKELLTTKRSWIRKGIYTCFSFGEQEWIFLPAEN